MKCSFFKDTYDKTPHNVNIDSILTGIKSGKWKDKIEEIRSTKNDKLKHLLPAATWAGTFSTERKASNIEDYTGIITIDIDDKNQEKTRKLKSMTTEDPFVFASFISPRGGIKILLRVDSTKDFHKTHAYTQVKQWVEDNYDGVKIDKSGSDVSRLCYVSFDPELYYNPKSQILPIDTTIVYEKPSFVVPNEINWDNRETNIQEIFNICKSWVEKRGLYYGKGSRNNYIHSIANLLNEAGLNERQIKFAISSNHSISSDMAKEVSNTVDSVCRRKAGKRGSIIIRSKNKKNLFNDSY